LLRADPKSLREAQLKAARTATHAQMAEFLAGRGSCYFLIRWAQRLRDTGTALAQTDAERFAYLDGYWWTVWQDERVQKARSDAGRTMTFDYLTPRYYRIEAEQALARSWQVLPKKGTRTPLPLAYGGYPVYLFDLAELGPLQLIDTKERARAKYAALRADPTEQLWAQLRTAREEYEEREGKRAGPLLWDAARHVLDSELALTTKEADRTTARERYWMHVKWSLENTGHAAYLRVLREAEILLLQGDGRPVKK
jgi:hypothetical protein